MKRKNIVMQIQSHIKSANSNAQRAINEALSKGEDIRNRELHEVEQWLELYRKRIEFAILEIHKAYNIKPKL